jgi:hypothetical protein
MAEKIERGGITDVSPYDVINCMASSLYPRVPFPRMDSRDFFPNMCNEKKDETVHSNKQADFLQETPMSGHHMGIDFSKHFRHRCTAAVYAVVNRVIPNQRSYQTGQRKTGQLVDLLKSEDERTASG